MLGQKFVFDSWAMGQVVFENIIDPNGDKVALFFHLPLRSRHFFFVLLVYLIIFLSPRLRLKLIPRYYAEYPQLSTLPILCS